MRSAAALAESEQAALLQAAAGPRIPEGRARPAGVALAVLVRQSQSLRARERARGGCAATCKRVGSIRVDRASESDGPPMRARALLRPDAFDQQALATPETRGAPVRIGSESEGQEILG